MFERDLLLLDAVFLPLFLFVDASERFEASELVIDSSPLLSSDVFFLFLVIALFRAFLVLATLPRFLVLPTKTLRFLDFFLLPVEVTDAERLLRRLIRSSSPLLSAFCSPVSELTSLP